MSRSVSLFCLFFPSPITHICFALSLQLLAHILHNSVKQALEAAIVGCERLKAEGIPYRRPTDYYAEMIKSDQHMAKVLKRLGEEKLRVEASEAAKRQRELRKFGKSVQKTKEKQREEARKRTVDAVRDWRKKHASGDEFPVELAEGDDVQPAAKAARKGAGDHNKRAPKPHGRRGAFEQSITSDMVKDYKKKPEQKAREGKRSKVSYKRRK